MFPENFDGFSFVKLYILSTLSLLEEFLLSLSFFCKSSYCEKFSLLYPYFVARSKSESQSV